jgi:hypothetical protein
MWNKRKEEEYPPKSAVTPTAPVSPVKESHTRIRAARL